MQSRHTQHMGVQVPVIVTLEDSERALTGECVDISIQGCFIVTAEAVALSSELFISLQDYETGNDIEIRGVVVRIEEGGFGVRVTQEASAEWGALVERTLAKQHAIEGATMQVTVLVAKSGAPTSGERAFYESSGWDVRFAVGPEEASSMLDSANLTAVIADFPASDIRWRDILKDAQARCPGARRILRTSLGDDEGAPNGFFADALIALSTIPQTRASLTLDPVIHQLAELGSGLEALTNALTASFSMD